MSVNGRQVITKKPWLQTASGSRNTQPKYQGPQLLSRVPSEYKPCGLDAARLKHAGGLSSPGFDPRRMTLKNAAGTTSNSAASHNVCGLDNKIHMTMPDGSVVDANCNIENPTIPGTYNANTGTQADLETTYIEATHVAELIKAGGDLAGSQKLGDNSHTLGCFIREIEHFQSGTPYSGPPNPTCPEQPADCPGGPADYYINTCSGPCMTSACLPGIEAAATQYQTMLNQVLETTALDYHSAANTDPGLKPPLTAKKIEQFLVQNPNMLDGLNISDAIYAGNNVNLATILQFIDTFLLEWETSAPSTTLQTMVSTFCNNAMPVSDASIATYVQLRGYQESDFVTNMCTVRQLFWAFVYNLVPGSDLQTSFSEWIGGWLTNSIAGFPSAAWNDITPNLYQTPSAGQWSPQGSRWTFIAFQAFSLYLIYMDSGQAISQTVPDWVMKNYEFNSTDFETIPSQWTFGVWSGGDAGQVCFPASFLSSCTSTPVIYTTNTGMAALSPAMKGPIHTIYPPEPLTPLTPTSGLRPLSPPERTPKTLGPTVQDTERWFIYGGLGLLIGYALITKYGFPQVAANGANPLGF